jgi:hypothetical protein
MGWSGEWLRQALCGPIRVEYFRAPSFTFVHDTGILEFFDESFFTPSFYKR